MMIVKVNAPPSQSNHLNFDEMVHLLLQFTKDKNTIKLENTLPARFKKNIYIDNSVLVAE